MIFGTDTSKYQLPGTYDPGSFEIVNGEDPTWPIKAQRNAGDNRPTAPYIWQYGYDSPISLCDRLLRAIDKAGVPMTLEDGWWDYEDTGISQATLEGACARARDNYGLSVGYYSNTWRVNHNAFLREFSYWPCAYPGANLGQFPGFGALASPRPSQIWQFSSRLPNGAGLDQNVIVDEDWYFRVTAAAPPAPPPAPIPPKKANKDMDLYVGPRNGQIGNVATLMQGSLVVGEWPGGEHDNVFGMSWPKGLSDWWNDQIQADRPALHYLVDVPFNGEVMARIRWGPAVKIAGLNEA